MSERESGGGGVFNIGSQQAGVINNVAGDQQITGGQQGAATFASTAEALAQLDRLRAAMERLALSDPVRAQAAEAIESAQAELQAPEPDKGRVAGHLERFTRMLRQAGALLAAGEAVAAPLQSLAAWLGPLGAPLLGLLLA
jgi:hypothetical protein